jgi:hyperosmotically inducible periplasmic protein
MKSRLLLSVGLALFVTACSQTDTGITTSVKSQMVADDTVKARNINVDTLNGVVTLKGEVKSQAEETKAVQIARSTKGVSEVVDQLVIVPDSAASAGAESSGVGAAISDAAITATVKSKLLADPETSALRIDVDTKDRMVTLSGSVKSAAEKSEAVTIARQTDGVLSVNDQLTVQRGN